MFNRFNMEKAMKTQRLLINCLSTLALSLGVSMPLLAQTHSSEGLVPLDDFERQLMQRQQEVYEQMSPAEKEAYLERQRYLYEQWNNLSPEQQEQLRNDKRNMQDKWRTMSPEEKEQLRQQRTAMRERIKVMSPEERQEYLKNYRDEDMNAKRDDTSKNAEQNGE